MVEVATSLLSVNKENIIKTIYDIEVAGTDYFHIDVMDGEFVKNDTQSIMLEYTEYIKQIANTNIEVHLMVKDVKKYIKQYIDMDVNCILFHIESLENEEDILNIINEIKSNNIKVGIAINPDTKIEKIYNYIPYIHRVLIMSVTPGEGGQEFLKEVINKIEKLKKYIDENNFDTDIEVDGGINEITATNVIDAGCNILVAGTYICKSDDYKEAIDNLKK